MVGIGANRINFEVLIGQGKSQPLVERPNQGFSAIVDSEGVNNQDIVREVRVQSEVLPGMLGSEESRSTNEH